VDKAVLDHCGLGVHPHDLVGLRLVAGGGVQAELDLFLDQLGARGLVLDQEDIGIEGCGLLDHRALQFGIFHAPAQYVQQRSLPAMPQLVHTLRFWELVTSQRGKDVR
jgi:hypothetical protein